MMFRLKLLTDPRWVNVAEKNVEDILIDHAYCEQKAASSAISIIILYPEYPEIVNAMAELAQEEMEHFKRVHDFILKRGYKFGHERKDDYVNQLFKFMKKGNANKSIRLVDHLLVGAMIEARSCERFKSLSEGIADQELAEFYRELMESEAAHYTMFITLARTVMPRDYVDKRWHEMLEFEEQIIRNLSNTSTVHG